MRYRTKQRDEVLRFFMDHEEECFSAREVYEQVEAGEATVFRAVAALVADGLLTKYTGGNGRGEFATYRYNSAGTCADHIHLKCDRCGRLIHMDCSFMRRIAEHFLNEHGFAVDCGRTVIYGLCEACRTEAGTDETR